MRKKTTEEFIVDAKKVHGDKYDYSKVEYKGNHVKVNIICRQHKDFYQIPKTHLNGHGCSKCSKTYSYTTEEWIEKAKEVHGDMYDYSRVEYKNSSTKVVIICKTHGEFEQIADTHLSGHGCPKCFGGYLYTTKEWIKKAKEVHGDTYDYSRVEYKNSSTKVIIICKTHGEFLQTPNSHISQKQRCPKCASNYSYSTEQWIEKARKVHGDKYLYDKVDYKSNKIKIIIVCKIHGEFLQTPNGHVSQKRGCRECQYVALVNKNGFTTEQWIEKARKVHGDTYDYSKVEYQTSHFPVTIICKIHGEFEQIASSHINQKSGCSKCAKQYSHTTEEWIEIAKKVHGNKYDYSKVNYMKNKVKILIVCKIHGEFEQIPNSHLSGHGCPKCCGVYSHTTEEWIEIAKKVHENEYDYSKVRYVNNKTKITIICKIHGPFEQTPKSHIVQQAGCNKCSKCYSYTTKEWIEQARKIRGDTYDYSKVEYKGNKIDVCIICKDHGEFYQSPNNHLTNNSGCQGCSIGFSKLQITWLNSISDKIKHAQNGGEFKIPKTRYRADGYDEKTKTVYEFHGDFWHGNPSFYHPEKINPVSKKKFGKLFKRTLHKEMKIRNLGYNYVCIWEHEYLDSLDD